jgi:hypothetical protein
MKRVKLIFISKRFMLFNYFWLIFLSLIFIGACTSSQPTIAPEVKSSIIALAKTMTAIAPTSQSIAATPKIIPTVEPITTPPHPSFISGVRYKLSIQNGALSEVHVFMDGQLMMSIPTGRMGTVNGIPEGAHIFLYCQDKSMKSCSSEHTSLINQNMVWVVGTGLKVSATQVLLQNFEPAPGVQPQPTVYVQTPVSGAADPFATDSSITGITVPIVMVHNRYLFDISVYMDGQYLFSVPARMYITYEVPGGWHTFRFWYAYGWLTTREVEVKGLTEMIISP